MLSYNKKGQIGETMTWVVATIIIIATLVVSFYITDGLAKGKGVIDRVKEVSVSEDNSDLDLITEKSLFVLIIDNSYEKEILDFMELREDEDKTFTNWKARLNKLRSDGRK